MRFLSIFKECKTLRTENAKLRQENALLKLDVARMNRAQGVFSAVETQQINLERGAGMTETRLAEKWGTTRHHIRKALGK